MSTEIQKKPYCCGAFHWGFLWVFNVVRWNLPPKGHIWGQMGHPKLIPFSLVVARNGGMICSK